MKTYEVTVTITLRAKSPGAALDAVDLALVDLELPDATPYTITIELPKQVQDRSDRVGMQ